MAFKMQLGCDAGFDQAKFLGSYQHLYPLITFPARNLALNYVVLGYELKLDINLNNLPADQSTIFL